jgi:hypothetical protein
VKSTDNQIEHFAEVTDIASSLKEYGKRIEGSVVVKERRQDAVDPARKRETGRPWTFAQQKTEPRRWKRCSTRRVSSQRAARAHRSATARFCVHAPGDGTRAEEARHRHQRLPGARSEDVEKAALHDAARLIEKRAASASS